MEKGAWSTRAVCQTSAGRDATTRGRSGWARSSSCRGVRPGRASRCRRSASTDRYRTGGSSGRCLCRLSSVRAPGHSAEVFAIVRCLLRVQLSLEGALLLRPAGRAPVQVLPFARGGSHPLAVSGAKVVDHEEVDLVDPVEVGEPA